MAEIPPERLLLTVEEAAERLGIGKTLAWELVWDGVLPSVRLGRCVRIPHNVAALASPPALRRRELRPLSAAEVKRLWLAAWGTRWVALILVAATSGLRQGEVLGLKWADVDLERGTLQVHRQLGRDKAFKEPKAGSKRPLDLTTIEVAVLRAHRRWQDERRREAGAAW